MFICGESGDESKDAVYVIGVGGNEYGQCGEEPERKDDTGRPPRRDIVIPQRCAPRLVVRQVICFSTNVYNLAEVELQ